MPVYAICQIIYGGFESHTNFLYSYLPVCKITSLIFSLYKRGTEGDFRNLPRPLFYKEGATFSPFIKGRCKRDFIKSIPDFFYPLVLPLFKRGTEGDFKKSPPTPLL